MMKRAHAEYARVAPMLPHMVQDNCRTRTVSDLVKLPNSIIFYVRPQTTTTTIILVLKLQWQTPQPTSGQHRM